MMHIYACVWLQGSRRMAVEFDNLHPVFALNALCVPFGEMNCCCGRQIYRVTSKRE